MVSQVLVGTISYEVQLAAWFDWMRGEISQSGIDLPNEESSVLFAAKAMQTAGRIRGIVRHFPHPLEELMVKSSIVFQCWQEQKRIRAESGWQGTDRKLRSVDAVRVLGTIGQSGRHQLVLANDGHRYVTTLCTGFSEDRTPATEFICNELARMIGLPVPGTAVITLNPNLARAAHRAWAKGPDVGKRLSPQPCFGSRYLVATQNGFSSDIFNITSLGPRNLRYMVGSLIFDIWTLNEGTRSSVPTFDAVTGRTEPTFVGFSGCLMGSNWGNFLKANYETFSPPRAVASRVKRWQQLDPWLQNIRNLDLNSLWDLVFQMPPSWYGARSSFLGHILDGLANRSWDLSRVVHSYLHRGYFPDMKLPCKCSSSDATLILEPPA